MVARFGGRSPLTGEPLVRRLAAIFAADVAGYSRLTHRDEEGTHLRLKEHLRVLVDPKIAAYRGRIVKNTGDGLLAEFGSVVDAMRCAVDVQRGMVERNSDLAPDDRIEFRIGINIGDVIEDNGDIFGDGVNVAARLEAIAEPGGICVSEDAHRQLRDKIDIAFDDIGEQHLKNIERPVRAFRVRGDASAARPRPTLALPDKPSIAVLPFDDLSPNPEYGYFADGIVEDITMALSRFGELFVIARNSAFQYKGKTTDVREIGRDLGVRYVLEGSVRRAGNRLRISVRLIDARTGGHRWAEHYDRQLEDVFAVQDEVVGKIVAILAAHVRKAETERTRTKPPSDWRAYDYYLQAAEAFASLLTSFDVKDVYETRRLLHLSIGIDPSFARSYALLANTHDVVYVNRLDGDYLDPAALDLAHQFARKAVQLDPNLPETHVVLALGLAFARQHDASIASLERATALNPNYIDWRFGYPLVLAGHSKRAVEMIGSYMRLDPFHPPAASLFLGFAHFMLKDYSQALAVLGDYVSRAPQLHWGHLWLAATHAQLGQAEKAQAEIAELLRMDPGVTISSPVRTLTAFKHAEDNSHFYDALRKAGLPE
jgi:adenylate cyclase